jgi:hypothetical protein
MMMLEPADQTDTPKALISGGRINVIRHVSGPAQPSENRMERAKLVRNKPYLHGRRLITFLTFRTAVCFNGLVHYSGKEWAGLPVTG